jgi:hypothetical protein
MTKRSVTIYYRDPLIPVFVAVVPRGIYTGIYIYPDSYPLCWYEGGHYDNVTKSLNLCLDQSGNLSRSLIAHEYFHAIQASYWGVVHSPSQKWIIEGTATAAANAPLLQRYPNMELHRIDVGLMEWRWQRMIDPFSYQAQDFFVYLGLAKGETLAYLMDVLLAGPTAQSVNDAIAQRFQSTLQIEYRNWAKNQVIEKEIDFDPDGPAGPQLSWLQNPCQIQANVVGLPRWSPFKLRHEMHYPDQDSLELKLGYLTSEMVEIEFANPEVAHVNVKVEVKGVAPNPFFKVYLNQPGDIDGMACRNIAEGPRFLTVPAVRDQTTPWEAYVLLSNTRYEGDSPLSYVVSVEVVD